MGRCDGCKKEFPKEELKEFWWPGCPFCKTCYAKVEEFVKFTNNVKTIRVEQGRPNGG